ncbi:MAG: GntR family transcriptional regulator, partial [Candidatus Binatia bacterium]
MKLDIHIIKDSEVTIREQLVEQIIFLIATGKLQPGEALPSVRGLARPHKIHHNTISQAYQDLVDRDWLIGRRGSRMVVRSPGEREYPPRVEDLDDLINATIKTAKEKGYSFQQLRKRVEERLM